MNCRKGLIIQVLVLVSLFVALLGCAVFLPNSSPDTPTADPSATSMDVNGYRNAEYGFFFALPESWAGYSVRFDQWEGLTSDSVRGDIVVDQGPMISIVHPNSTPAQPRQDIPIMVFTIAQWENMTRGDWHIGAAPIGPGELGRNSRYVFALPARYNYAFPEGWEEVEQILQGQPLETFEPEGS